MVSLAVVLLKQRLFLVAKMFADLWSRPSENRQKGLCLRVGCEENSACEDSRIVPGVEFNVQEESLMGEGDLFLGLYLQCMDVPRLGVKSEL